LSRMIPRCGLLDPDDYPTPSPPPMPRSAVRRRAPLLAASLVFAAVVSPAHAQRPVAPAQKIDQEYTAKIKEYLQDPRITTELVDHLPASATVPTPLKFLGRIVGTPGELTHAKDIHRYLDAIAKAARYVSRRACLSECVAASHN